MSGDLTVVEVARTQCDSPMMNMPSVQTSIDLPSPMLAMPSTTVLLAVLPRRYDSVVLKISRPGRCGRQSHTSTYVRTYIRGRNVRTVRIVRKCRTVRYSTKGTYR